MLKATSQDVRNEIIKVDRKLALSEQICSVNDTLCYGAKATDVCILVKIEVGDGYRFLHYRLWPQDVVGAEFMYR